MILRKINSFWGSLAHIYHPHLSFSIRTLPFPSLPLTRTLYRIFCLLFFAGGGKFIAFLFLPFFLVFFSEDKKKIHKSLGHLRVYSVVNPWTEKWSIFRSITYLFRANSIYADFTIISGFCCFFFCWILLQNFLSIFFLFCLFHRNLINIFFCYI